MSLSPSQFSFLDSHSPPSGLAHSTPLQVLSDFFCKAPWDSNQTTESDANLGNLMLMKHSQQFCYCTWILIAINSFSPLDPGNSDKLHFHLELLFCRVAGYSILRSLARSRSLTFSKQKLNEFTERSNILGLFNQSVAATNFWRLKKHFCFLMQIWGSFPAKSVDLTKCNECNDLFL